MNEIPTAQRFITPTQPLRMDWRLVQSLIRKHRSDSKKLLSLYAKTNDPQFAYALGSLYETSDPAIAIEWLQKAASKFQRQDWVKIAEEKIHRLHGEQIQ